MTLLRISELAERSGVPSSTLRYYERIGLVAPIGRADNGSRVYDEAALERLAFIGRAKRLGMRLNDVATLIEAWFAGECQPLHERLRQFVTGRLAEVRAQMAEDSAFERHLERILAGLGEPAELPERCGPDCGCDTDPLEAAVPSGDPRLAACSLGDQELPRRLGEWRRVLAKGVYTAPAEGRWRVAFDPSAGVVVDLARLCVAETACCPFFTFNLDITSAGVVLTVAGDEEMTGRLFEANVASSSPRASTPDWGEPGGRREALVR